MGSEKLEVQIEKLEQQRSQIADRLKTKKQQLRARRQSEERKKRTRRLILWGTVVEKLIAAGELKSANFKSACQTHLTTERDIADAGALDD